MRLITYNVNGIRAAIRKGFLDWLAGDPADIVCLQEVKAFKENIDYEVITKLGYHQYWFSAQKKGYSGVAVFTKEEPQKVFYGNGYEQSDYEGRVIRLDFKDFTLINAYFPSGTSGDLRQTYKYQWLDEFFDYVQPLIKEKKNVIVCGDYNICHKAIDIHDPVRNKKSSGFLPEERAWMDKWFSAGFLDSFRQFNQAPHQYSWWSYRARARSKNKGWRLDYISASDALKNNLQGGKILSEIVHSDHCPVFLEFD
ncbi:MAG TPA: exodeoxyribonuclease III [Chitinophagaceae bacterium]|nr:exodeoxyribonuclease III [Chitinophagaceae bacterium]